MVKPSALPVPDRVPFLRARVLPAAGAARPVAGFVVMGSVMAGGLTLMPELGPAMGIGVAVLLPLMAMAGRSWWKSPRAGGPVEVRAEGLFVAGRLGIPRAEIEQAIVARGAEGATVVIQQRSGYRTVISVGSEEEGRQLVAALRLDPTTALSAFSFDTGLRSLPKALFYAYLAAMIAAPLLLLPLFATRALPLAALGIIPWCLSIVLGAIPTRLTVGLDGLVISWLWRRQFVRFSELQSCKVEADRLHLSGPEGHDLALAADWQAYHPHSQENEVGFQSKTAYLEAVGARIREAAEASRERRSLLVAGQLARSSRPVADWARELRGLLVDRVESFRENAALPEQFWGTLEDTQAPAEIRAAAAAALAPTLDPEGRQRLRVAAAVALAPGLRVALEAAASQDDAALEEALAGVCEPPSAARRLPTP